MPFLRWLLESAMPGLSSNGSESNNNNTITKTASVADAPTASSLPPSPAVAQSAAAPTLFQSLPSPQPQQPLSMYDHFFSRRSLRQLGVFLGGAGFFYWSVLVSRRAVARHQLAARLKFYQPNHLAGRTSGPESIASSSSSFSSQASSSSGGGQRDPFVAFQALNLATLNTLSFFLMGAGGVAWALDISDMGDLRRMTRRALGGAASGSAVDDEVEKEVALWVAKTLGMDMKVLKEKGAEEGGKGK